jgi:hypothetical protein
MEFQPEKLASSFCHLVLLQDAMAIAIDAT